MAYHKEGDDLVIDGFAAGIADAPELGTAFMRNLNLISVPGEASVNFATQAISTPPSVSSASCTFTGATDVVSWTASATLYNGVAITFGSTAGGVTAGTIYWVGSVSGATFKVYTNVNRDVGNIVDLTDASNTFSTIVLGKPSYKALDTVGTASSPNNVFMLDTNGRAWWVNTSGNLVHLGNSTLTSTHGNGICVLGAFLYVFRDAAIDYLPVDAITNSTATGGQWVSGWKTANLNSNSANNNHSHFALAAQDNGMYFCNDQFVGSVLATSGNNVDPSSSSTFTYNAQALRLPAIDLSTCLAELGTSLMVGGIQNKIYPWDRVSTSYTYPVVCAEANTTRMVTTNSTTYVFAGNRGRIYQTNGANIQLFKKIPDHIVQIFSASNGLDPYFTWKDAMYWKNQIYFSFEAAKNDGTVITNIGGIWAVDVSMNTVGTPMGVALRMVNTLTGGAADVPSVLAPNIRTSTPGGAGIYAGWYSTVDSTYGVDVTTTTPYTNSGIGGEIYTDLIPTGTFVAPKTFNQVEFKLAKPMVSGESVRLSMRQNNSESFTVLGTTSTTVLSTKFSVGEQNGQWIQFYIELFSTGTTPSFVPLVQIRFR